jgi:hypothetical protein
MSFAIEWVRSTALPGELVIELYSCNQAENSKAKSILPWVVVMVVQGLHWVKTVVNIRGHSL